MKIIPLKLYLVRCYSLQYGTSRNVLGEEKGEAKMGEDTVEAKGGGLTVAKVKTAKPGKYHDGAGTGLFLRVDPNGGRFWIQRVTIHGKRREIGLGGFPRS